MYSLALECERRYNIKYDMPIGVELKIGKDWLNLQEISWQLFVDNLYLS